MAGHRPVLAVAALGAILLLTARAGAQPAQPAPQPDPVAAAVASAAKTTHTADPPATLYFVNRPVVLFRATVMSRPPSERAAAVASLLDELVDRDPTGQVSTRTFEDGIVVRVGERPVFVIFPADVDALAGEGLAEKGRTAAAQLGLAFSEAVEARTPRKVLSSIAVALAATLLYGLAIWLLIRFDLRVAGRASSAAERRLRRLPGGEVMVVVRAPALVRWIFTAAGVALGLLLSYTWLAVVLRRFPYTRPWGESLRGGLFSVVGSAGRAVLDELPNLLTLLALVFITRVMVRVVNLIFQAVEENKISLPGVHPETAQPTRRIAVALLWLFALVVSYEYLPGSESDAFKGVSVFVGLVVSLGSTGIMNQVMSGLMLTYSRALRVGDFVRVAEIEGTVTHVGTLSTKIRTPRNEDITIPNAVVVSHATTNFSRHASDGVYTATSVTIGYDAPWRQVHALLLLAAERTPGVRPTPKPAVLQTALCDFYVQYTLLVSIEQPQRRLVVLNTLHGNVQDLFNEYGVQIMSPNYEADPDAPKLVPPSRWYSAPAPAPAAAVAGAQGTGHGSGSVEGR